MQLFIEAVHIMVVRILLASGVVHFIGFARALFVTRVRLLADLSTLVVVRAVKFLCLNSVIGLPHWIV